MKSFKTVWCLLARRGTTKEYRVAEEDAGARGRNIEQIRLADPNVISRASSQSREIVLPDAT